MENLLEFATEECKVNYLNKEKTLNIFKIVLGGVQFPEDEVKPQYAYPPPPPQAYPNVESNVL
jgi:hypothetical protein